MTSTHPNKGIGYIPYNIGSRLQMDEAPGGVQVYLQIPQWAQATAPGDWIARTESAAFRSRVLNLGGGNVSHTGLANPSPTAAPMDRATELRKESFAMFPGAPSAASSNSLVNIREDVTVVADDANNDDIDDCVAAEKVFKHDSEDAAIFPEEDQGKRTHTRTGSQACAGRVIVH